LNEAKKGERMKHALQKVFLLSVLVMPTLFYATETELPILFRGDVSPTNAAYTISRSGVYTLTSAKTASGVPNISITANNVTLDLGGNTLTGGTNGIEIMGNNVTVKNGTTSGMTQSGVLVQGNGCRIDNCDMVSCVTGIMLQNSNQSVIENCRVRNMTQAGVSLVASYTNYVHGCSVTGVYSTGDVYGFISANGGSNVFDSCSVKNVGTTGEAIAPIYATVGLQSAIGGGIVFKGSENNSQVLNSSCLSVEQTTTFITQSFGIGLLPEVTSMQVDVLLSVTHSPDAEGLVRSVAWLVSGDTKYLASGGDPTGDTGNQIKIYRFDEATSSLLSVTQSPYAEGLVRSVAWLASGDTKYLASGGIPSGDTGNQVKIYRFDEATSSLLSVTHSPYAEGQVNSVAWLVSGDTKYLASGGIGTNEVKIYRFDEATSSLLSVTHIPYAEGEVQSVAWLVSGDIKYLASGGSGTNEVKIYRFDEATSSLLSVTHNPYAESIVNSVAWLVSGDTKYLASGGFPDTDTGNQVKIYRFDEATSSLLSVTQSPYAEGLVYSVAWLVSGDTKYLASGGYPSTDTGNQVKIYRFDEATSSLLSVTQSPYAEGLVYSVAWLVSGDTKYLASGGFPSTDTGNQVKMYEFEGFTQQSPQNCLLTNNALSSVHSFRKDLAIVGDVANGIGLSISTTLNYVASNVAYDCDSGFAGVPLQFIDSQANARGVDNIDTNLTTPDQIEAIYNDQLPLIENQVDALLLLSNSSVSAVDILSGCADIPVSAPGTLSTAGTYCLADTINGTLSITGTDITLCMNEHTINGGRLMISGDRVHVANGTVRNNAATSGVYLTGDDCFLTALRSMGNQTGFELSGADQNVITNCSAISCTREGFLLNTSTRNYLANCEVQSLVGTGTVAGFKTLNGTSNKIAGCTVNGVAATNGDAYGIWGVTEHKSIVFENMVNDVSAVAGIAKGLAMDEDTWLRSGLSFEWTFSTIETQTVRNIDWLSIRPGLSYVAIAESDAPNRIRIFRFNEPDELNLCYELPFSGGMFVARWLRIQNVSYLAVGGFNGVAGTDFKIYIFDEVSETLLPLPNAIYTYDTAAGLIPITAAWLRLEDDRTFLAVGGSTSTEGNVRVLSFDGNYLSLVTKANTTAGAVRGIDWVTSGSRYFLAVSTQVTNPALTVYEFDPTNNSLTSRATYNSVSGGALAVRWLSYKGDFFLGLTLTGGQQFRVLKYTVATNTLTYLVGVALANYSESCDWVATGTSLYAVFSGVDPSPELNVYTFNSSSNTLTSFYQSSFSGAASGVGLRCFTGLQGRALIAVGFYKSLAAENRELSIVGFDLIGSTTSVVQNNTVSNISGTGIAVNQLSNPVLSNTVYSATTSYEPWKPFQFDPSNNNGIAYS
jgi:parallel beta-helix repeat protein